MKKVGLSLFVSVVIVSCLFSGCELLNFLGLNPNGADNGDTDADGLTDEDEIGIYGTNPLSADTDGDGFTDYEELFTFSFNVDQDVARFNPLVADVPKYEIVISSEPDIELNMTTSTGSSLSQTITEASEHAQSYATGAAKESSSSIEANWRVEIGFDGGTSDGDLFAVGHIHGELGGAYTSSKTLALSEERSNEIITAHEHAKETARSEDYEITGGSLALTVDIVNQGHIAFTVSNMALSALLIDLKDDGSFAPIATLNPDSEYSSFQHQTVGPGESWESQIFQTDGLSYQLTEQLIYNPGGLVFKVSSMELVNVEHNSIVHEQTAIKANTAMIMIDDGDPNTEVEEYYVAVTQRRDADGNLTGLTVGEIFSQILRIPYTTAEARMVNKDGVEQTNTVFDSIREISADVAESRIWVAESNHDSFDSLDYGNIEEVVLNAGDVLALVYLVDNDHDGIGYREEKLFGSSDSLADTDQDGLTDYFEIREGWMIDGELIHSNPTRTDSDFDGLSDSDEVDPGTNPIRGDTDGDGFSDMFEVNEGTDPAEPTNALLSSLIMADSVVLSPEFDSDIHEYSSATTLDAISILAIPDSPTSTITIEGAATTPGVYSEPIPIALGSNTVVIEVTSDGGLVTDTYTISLENTEETMQLGSLSISEGTLTPAFSPSVYAYTATVHSDDLTITPSALNPLEGIEVRFKDVEIENVAGFTVHDLDVNADNTIKIIVSNVEQTDDMLYTLVVTNLLQNVDVTPDVGFEPILPQGDDGMVLNWRQVNDSRIADYVIVRSRTAAVFSPLPQSYEFDTYPHDLGNGFIVVSKVSNTQSTITDTGLDSDTTYYYTIFSHYFRQTLSDGTNVNQHFWSTGASVSGATRPRQLARVDVFLDQIYVLDDQGDPGGDLEPFGTWRFVATGNTDFTIELEKGNHVDTGSALVFPGYPTGYSHSLVHTMTIPRTASASFTIYPDIWEDDGIASPADLLENAAVTFSYNEDFDRFEQGGKSFGIPSDYLADHLDVANTPTGKGSIQIRYRFDINLVDP